MNIYLSLDSVLGRIILPPLHDTQLAEHPSLVDLGLVLAELEELPRQTGWSPLQNLDRVQVGEGRSAPARLAPARLDPVVYILVTHHRDLKGDV
jgi:hypothetical protein